MRMRQIKQGKDQSLASMRNLSLAGMALLNISWVFMQAGVFTTIDIS